jgi:hypothetical protein
MKDDRVKINSRIFRAGEEWEAREDTIDLILMYLFTISQWHNEKSDNQQFPIV